MHLPKVDYKPAAIPAWLSNPDLEAPCRCGVALRDTMEPHIIAIEASTGLSRWWHPECWFQFQKESGMMEDDES